MIPCTLSSPISLTISPFFDHELPIVLNNKQVNLAILVPSGLLPRIPRFHGSF